ncbi:cytochrome P450 family protein [Podospora didyma]|uniref:Cytochrome P450 family protein n=1 Tax=Podospora didyma TaxID=330526 RepID=A0AAE0K109_9PEZI|nr:cytochrome P450 family protein [Podospora didyma]
MALANLSLALLWGGVASLLVYIVALRITAWNRLRHIPGPFGVGWSKLWIFRHTFAGNLCLVTKAVCEKYGPITRIAPDWVIINDPAEVRRIWSVHSGYRRSDWYKGFRFDPGKDSILTNVDNKEHHKRRTLVLPAYVGKGLNDRETLIDEQMVKFIALVERKYLSDRTVVRPMEMGQTFQYLTQDATSAVEFGKAFGYVEADSDFYGAIEALEGMMFPCALVCLVPELATLMNTSFVKSLLPQPTDKHGIGRLVGLIKERVAERYGDAKVKNNDVLQRFVESGLTQSEVEAESMVHLLGGSDTTAMAMRTAVFFICTNPSVCRRLQEEIEVVAKTVTRPVIADSEAKQMRYLQACIKEALRIWPPITGVMTKTSNKDDVICGVKVPAGTNVAWTAFGVMRNKALFGEDAELFEPRRWLEADPDRLKEMEATQGLVFAAGTRWECLGKSMAYMELGKVLFELFLRYDFSMTNPAKPFEWVNVGFTVHEHMNVTITRRESGSGT